MAGRKRPMKTVRASNKFQLIYLVRKHRKDGWEQGKIEKRYNSNGAEWVCYMFMNDY